VTDFRLSFRLTQISPASWGGQRGYPVGALSVWRNRGEVARRSRHFDQPKPTGADSLTWGFSGRCW
jgi:hypothetical protein